MPTYTFERPDGTRVKRKLSFDEYDAVKSGEQTVSDDKGQLTLVFDPQGVGFVLKDGPSGGWMSKAGKENDYRSRRQKVMTKRETDHVFKTKLIPNYQGEEASSWKDVREEVRSKSGNLVASTYDHHVEKEESTAP
jgi:hypothetical protein